MPEWQSWQSPSSCLGDLILPLISEDARAEWDRSICAAGHQNTAQADREALSNVFGTGVKPVLRYLCPIWKNSNSLQIKPGPRGPSTKSYVRPLDFPLELFTHVNNRWKRLMRHIIFKENQRIWNVDVAPLFGRVYNDCMKGCGVLQASLGTCATQVFRHLYPRSIQIMPLVVSQMDHCNKSQGEHDTRSRHLFIFMYFALLRLKWVSWPVSVYPHNHLGKN
jgi:hypothetical protein